MAVQTWVYGKPDIQYKGCVLDTYERNGYDDSDWYAICWDKEKKEVVTVLYDTTRCGAGGTAKIDVTAEVLCDVYRYYKNMVRNKFDKGTNEAMARKIRKGDVVKVVRGRKVKQGTIGKVFWIGTRYNQYSYRDEDRIGIEIMETGEKVFLALEYAEVIGWESRLLTGRARKKEIQKRAANLMPVIWRSLFLENGGNFNGKSNDCFRP